MVKFRVIKSTKEDDDKGLGKALYELSKIFLQVTKEKDPEYYAWMMKRNNALRKERLAREARQKIEKQRPEQKR